MVTIPLKSVLKVFFRVTVYGLIICGRVTCIQTARMLLMVENVENWAIYFPLDHTRFEQIQTTSADIWQAVV